tara:strand:+ start:934 stop:1176 length:243 start_codon:yes stop_codon:yes gene_type:complete
MRRYKVFKRFDTNCGYSRNNINKKVISFNKWTMINGDDVMRLFDIMYEQLKTVNKNFLDMEDYETMLKEFMRHVYKYSNN